MRPKLNLIVKAILGVSCLIVYCEFVIYYAVLRNCDWPSLRPENEDATVAKTNLQPVRIMVLADTHLLGSRRGHWFDKLRREWQMHRAFQTAMTLHQPDAVFVLGDLTDEGLFCSTAEFKYYVQRFYSLFHVPEHTRLYVAVGNHDIGFHYDVNTVLNERFESALNAPAVQLISMRGNHFVLINSMALEGDGCFLCKDAELELMKIEKRFKCSNGTYSRCRPNEILDHWSKPILMQHFPLYRESDKDCDDPDSAPLSIKNELFREGLDCLSWDATEQLLKQLRPRLALSGHTHHGCTRELPIGDGVEITVPSFSWRNKNNPTYGLGVFTPNNYAFSKCAMPREQTVINLYVFGTACLIVWLIYCAVFNRASRFKFKIW